LMEAEIGRTTKETQPVYFEGGFSYWDFGSEKKLTKRKNVP
jgi:hypothetical protein